MSYNRTWTHACRKRGWRTIYTIKGVACHDCGATESRARRGVEAVKHFLFEKRYGRFDVFMILLIAAVIRTVVDVYAG